ncbi:TerC integral membrane domain-containing protein isoform 1 [Hibiscus syriacus]|uniref:TerC integral membrane domain-containing protein isoform 1 n=1 Tax=Hibiscus syriacus TaxID=106335 RepID=A0A6A2WX25_HIBSY|nr:protein MODIFIER OF SNC1 11-like [Hibiscus syriacus]XP_039055699.1 protein MODIFIER OF SNC1 11-like [Hibiscus syriacus]KAE8654296.1 TerC integral membrane domain-containing protein isoform 1 [Hibiscus syriacus]
MASTTDKPSASTAEANPGKTVDAPSPSTYKSDPPSNLTHPDAELSVKESEDSKTSGTAAALVAGESGGPVDDVQKKIRRAERFGLPVQLSEQEKRNSRAERFGTAPSSNGSEASKQSEELKRKARSERFGITAPATATDEEKKEARHARFAPYSKPDSVEEEKRKARAIRFSNPASSSLSQENGKGNLELEAPIDGKAGGEI